MLELVIFIVILALVFDFLNGMNDAANSISTVVATRVLPPLYAVGLAAFFNFAALFVFQFTVAKTIGKGIVEASVVTPWIVLAALAGAILWVAFATYFGLPVSVSHSLIGGFIGSAIVAAGTNAIIIEGVAKVITFIVVSPLIGMIVGFFFIVAILRTFGKHSPALLGKYFKKLQLISASLYSLSHGGNDAQKTMGIIAVLLFSAGYLGKEFHIPFWVAAISHATIALGTLLGGWHVVKTMGRRITHLKPVHGFCAESASAFSMIGATFAGIPVSTTHTIAASIMGVGMSKGIYGVRWIVARNIVWAWILTIPITAVTAGVVYFFIKLFI